MAKRGSQDEVHLQVIEASGDDREKKTATAVLRLLAKGKHWVLVTLLLSNVITNETLPIVLDRALGCGWQAVLGSTVLIGMYTLLSFSFSSSSVNVIVANASWQSYSVKSSPNQYAFVMV